VCLGEQEVSKELPCRHKLCNSCALDWLGRNATCPLCRAPARCKPVSLIASRWLPTEELGGRLYSNTEQYQAFVPAVVVGAVCRAISIKEQSRLGVEHCGT